MVSPSTTRSAAGSSDPDWASRAQGALGWAALGVTLVSALALGANRPAAWSALAAAGWMLFILQLVLDALGPGLPRRAAKLAPAAALYLAVLLWGAFQLSAWAPAAWTHPAWSEVAGLLDGTGRMAIDPVEGWHVLMRLATYPMLFWIAFRAGVRPERVRAYIGAVAIWSAGLAIYGIVTMNMRSNPILEGVTSQRHDVLASFVNSNAYAFYAGIGVMANIAALMFAFDGAGGGGRARRLRLGLEALLSGGWIFLVGAGIAAAAMTLTGSRAGVGASLGGILTFTLIMLVRREGKGLGAAQIAAVAAFLLIAVYALASGLFRVLDKAASTGAAEERFHVYPRIVEAIAERPLLGAGPGGFSDVFRAWVPVEAATGDWLRAHNSFLENAFEFGIPAALAFYLALFLILRRTWRGAMTRRRMIAVPAFAVSIGVAGGLHSMVDFSLQMPATAALFAMCLGLGFAQSFSSRRR
jgi:O-antigen ligase